MASTKTAEMFQEEMFLKNTPY